MSCSNDNKWSASCKDSRNHKLSSNNFPRSRLEEKITSTETTAFTSRILPVNRRSATSIRDRWSSSWSLTIRQASIVKEIIETLWNRDRSCRGALNNTRETLVQRKWRQKRHGVRWFSRIPRSPTLLRSMVAPAQIPPSTVHKLNDELLYFSAGSFSPFSTHREKRKESKRARRFLGFNRTRLYRVATCTPSWHSSTGSQPLWRRRPATPWLLTQKMLALVWTLGLYRLWERGSSCWNSLYWACRVNRDNKPKRERERERTRSNEQQRRRRGGSNSERVRKGGEREEESRGDVQDVKTEREGNPSHVG